MTGQDIIKAGKVKVRNSSSLYPAYLTLFETVFGREPECPTCGSIQGNRDWSAFEHYVRNNEILTTNLAIVENTTSFVLRDKNKIYSYDFKHTNGRILRAKRYGYAMDEDFAVAYLTNADQKQLEARKAEFKVLPKAFSEEVDDAIDLSSLTVAELKANLKEQFGYKDEDFRGLKKEDLLNKFEAELLKEADADVDADANADVDADANAGADADAAAADANDSLLD